MKKITGIILLLIITGYSANAQTDNWLKIIKETKVAVKYFSPVKSESFTMIQDNSAKENEFSFIKQFSNENLDVKLTFKKYDSHLELSGEVSSLNKEDLCFTLKIIFPSNELKNVTWSYDLDSIVTVGANTKIFSNYVEASTVIPPAGAFNTDENHNGGYGDKVGNGQMSFYPLASITTDKVGYGWGVDIGIPVVFRLAYEPKSGMISEFDFAISKETKKFPNRTFFKLHLFEYNPDWNMRAAFEKYYQVQPEYFKKRVTQEGIWLPFAPLLQIKGWKDFGFAFHETSFQSKDHGLKTPLSSIEAGKFANVFTFQYTDPWEIELPIKKIDTTYDQVTGKDIISNEHAEYIQTSAVLDKDNKIIARKLETPWFSSGWAVSITTNTDPDIKGFNRYDYVNKHEIYPAIERNVDGIYFDCLEWNWQYDLNYNHNHFEYTDYPLTFSSSLENPRPVIWCYSSDYEMMKKVADDMHAEGKLVMGNGYGWIPFEAGALDLFGSELNWHAKAETGNTRLQFYRAISYQKPLVFLLNEGLDDDVFTKPPYDGYKIYFEKMLFYGFFPSFFSVNSSSNVYWADSVKYNQGRPYFKKYIPLIKEIAQAGWQPITLARLNNKELKIERFGAKENSNIYFTLYNSNEKDAQSTVTIDTKDLNINKVISIEEIIEGKQLKYKKNAGSIEVKLNVKENSTCLIKINKQ
jgi:hypothetical protein